MAIKSKKSLAVWGFTLVELIVSIAVLAILSTIGLTTYKGQVMKGRDGRRKADLEQVRSALEMCRADISSYPAGALTSGQDIICGTTTYMKIPNDPVSSYRYYYVRISASNYSLCAHLEIDGTPSSNCGSLCNAECNYEVNQP